MKHSFSYTLLITWVLLLFSCKTPVVQKSYETENISISAEVANADENLVALYMPYKAVLEKDMNRVISVSSTEMKKDKPESLLTNFLADLLLEEAKAVADNSNLQVTPDVSFFNYGGIRTSLPSGEITVGKIYELMPFENEMVFLKLSSTQMQEFLNYVAAKGGDSLGGARFIITEGKAKQAEIGGKPLEQDNNYWLVTNDYVANGGDGLDVLKGSEQFIKSGIKIRDAIITYLEKKQKNNETLVVKLDGRMRYE
jgi:2',3'-cyclic-nucleotide 2'-phosphodiesterase (5'-nucleotidase family)